MCRKLVRHRDGQAGFTLLELVVVVGVISIVLAVLTLGIRRASDAYQLRRATTTAITEMRRAQSSAVAEGSEYVVEFVIANPGSLNIYRPRLATETSCPTAIFSTEVLVGSTWWCQRTITSQRQQWPSSVAINGGGTTFGPCAAPANTANKCVTFRPLGYADAGGVAQLVGGSGVTVKVAVTAATGRVSVQP